ncbi:hypothetical protein [Emcibacter sp. SYSU 3D8]|uniref:hypothetical protein n=1 Tax=Emcibacter sp. SYSU 3D8 TaxID=3133969 RepID=UPI0031FE59A9
MILGLSVSAFTTLHVAISLIAIAAGLVVLYGMIRGMPMPMLNHLFLATTVATTLSGFLFPISGLTPALMTGLVSSILLGAALFAYYRAHLKGRWRGVYVVTAVAALYLNCFVLVVQSFQKLGVLQPLAPTQSEPPFLAAQGTVLLTFVLLGYLAFKRGRAAVAAN